MKRGVFLVIAAANALLFLGSGGGALAADKPCRRWNNGLDPCDGVIEQPTCGLDQSQWSFNQVLVYRNWLYSGSAAKACRKWVIKHWGLDYLPSAVGSTATPGLMNCWKDENGDGQITSVDKVPGKTVSLETNVTRDACCSRAPFGPYRQIQNTITPQRGGEFRDDEPLINAIYARNRDDHQLNQTPNVLGSDIGVLGGDVADQLGYTPCVFRRPDDAEFEPNPPLISRPLCPSPTGPRANIDHIIPRIDSNGCSCGDNSSANALVISGQLNTEMRNSCLDPKRIQILNAWTASPPR
jgi:hypothetical protein